MVNIVNQARLFQTYRKFFGWDDESSHYEVQLYSCSSPSTSENVVLFSEDGTCALRYSGGTVVFVGVHDQDDTVYSAMAKAATSQISVKQTQLVTAALGKPDHPPQQWQRFLYLTTDHLHAPEAMLACHAKSEETADLSMLAFEVVRSGMLPNIYSSTAHSWPGGDLVEHKLQSALPSTLDAPVFALLTGGKEPSLLVARIAEDETSVCLFIGTGAGSKCRREAYKALQHANPGKFSESLSEVSTVVLSKETSPAIIGIYAALLAVNLTWRSSDDVVLIFESMDIKANAAALFGILRILEPCSARKGRSSLGQRVRETEIMNATLQNEIKIKDSKIAALSRRIKKLGGEVDMNRKAAMAAQTSSVALQVELEAVRPPIRSNVMHITDVVKGELAPMKSLASWASGLFQERTLNPPHSYPENLIHMKNPTPTKQIHASIRVRVYSGGPIFNVRDAYLCTLSHEKHLERYVTHCLNSF